MSIYDTSSLGTVANRVNFNNNTVFPVFRVISRMPTRRQVRELDIPVPFESGISDFETLLGQVAYVLDGIMYPGGESEYDAGLAQLRKLASLEVAQDDNASDQGYVPYIFTEFERDKQIFMKVLYVDIREDTRKGLVQPFRLLCKIKDPTIYETVVRVADTSPADFTVAEGAALYPFEYPIIYGSSTSSVSASAENIGDLPVYPQSIVIHGPVNSPKITNETTGQYIQVTTNLPLVSNVLTITYDKDSLVVDVDGISVLDQVTTDSEFFKIQPGINEFTLSGTSVGDDAYAQVNFLSGWSLS